jgi:HTH-type transcriptional regulator / antitoxin MqsA
MSRLENALCLVCGEGKVHREQTLRPIEYGGVVGHIPLSYTLCEVCGSETVDDHESTLNRRAYNRFKKQVDGVPLGSQIRTMRKVAGLSQAEAGALLGGGPVAFSKYESDDLIPDSGMANLLRLAIADASVISKLRELRSGGTASAIKVYQLPSIASASATWVNEEMAEEEADDPGDAAFTSSASNELQQNAPKWTLQ